MKTFKQLQEEISARRIAELKAKGKGDAVKAQMKADNTKVAPHQGAKEKAKRMPPAGGALATRPSSAITKAADKGRAIVKAKSSAITPSKPGALATQRPNKPGDNSKKMGRVPKPYRSGPNREDPSTQKPGNGKNPVLDTAKNLAGSAWKSFMKAGKATKGPPEARKGSIDAPKRGVYNG